MNFQSYLDYFENVLNNPAPLPPYDKPDYFNYAKLNWSRMQHWLENGKLTEEIQAIVSNIKVSQHWIVITEPWCGDAAQIVPFIQLLAELNPLIKVEYELRDAEPFRINTYLTRGGKSIPKLIIRNETGDDLATWGPRPADCQVLFDRLKEEKADFKILVAELQNWYTEDNGGKIGKEIGALLK